MNHLVELTCKLFEQTAEAEQAKYWQPLIYPLVWHEVNIISQRRYFTRAEELNIEAKAKYIAKYVILPPVKTNFDVLLEETAFRGLVLDVFHSAEIHFYFAQRCSPTVPNEISFLNSLTYLREQEGLFVRGLQEVIKRIRNNWAADLALGATETGKTTFTQRLQNELAEQTSWMSLPEHTRLDKIGDSVQDWLNKLMTMPVMERYKNSFLTALNVKRDLNDEYTRLTETKKGNFEAGMKSLDEEVETADGSRTSMLEILEAESESLRTQPEEELSSKADPYDVLVADIRDVHGDEVAETAEVYFEIYFQQETKKKVKRLQVARALRKDRETISKHIQKIEKILRERMKKN